MNSTEKTSFLPQNSKGVRALVVSHDLATLTLIWETCNQCDQRYQVVTCSTASLAMSLLKEAKDCFDMILVDSQMPGLDPYDFIKYVRQQIKIPIILISEDESDHLVNKAFENGADRFWCKPLDETRIKQMWYLVKQKEVDNKPCVGEPSDVDCVSSHFQPLQTRSSLLWTPELKRLFENIMDQLKPEEATPKLIVERMNVQGLTTAHVSSRLQKWRDSNRPTEVVRKVGRKKSKRASDETKVTHPTSSSEQSLPLDSLIQCDNNNHAEHNHDQVTNTIAGVPVEPVEFLPDVEVDYSMQEEQNVMTTSDSFNQYGDSYITNMFSSDLYPEQQDTMLQSLLENNHRLLDDEHRFFSEAEVCM